MLDCRRGPIDDSNFGKPMPIIGLYIAGASLLCIIAMVMDLVKGIKSKQFWIPAKYFSINAASLIVVGVAIKLSVDLNSSMPSTIDQLAKLATSAFICTVLVNSLPSLGKLEKGEILTNAVGFAILIITSIVNLCIQLKTGVIHAFTALHVFMMVVILVLFLVCFYTTAYLLVMKNYLQFRFETLNQQALPDYSFDENKKTMVTEMKEYLMKFSMMAQSSCPHFVLSRSKLCIFVTVCGLVSASALFLVLLATVSHKDRIVGLNTCSGESDYGWSVLGILITQTIAVAVGLAAPLTRMCYIIKASVSGAIPPCNDEDKFWMWHLNETEEDIENRQQSPADYLIKQVIRSLFELFKLPVNIAFKHMLVPLIKSSLLHKHTGSNHSNKNPSSDSLYFLNVEGEKIFIDYVEECHSRSQKVYENAKKNEPNHLIEFLQRHLSHDFRGVLSFESERVPPLSSAHGRPPNCWALPVVTLTCIATALPNIDSTSKEQLKMCVNEGLVYVNLLEDKFNNLYDFFNVRAAANMVQLGLDRGCWLDKDLEGLARDIRSPIDVLILLTECAKMDFYKIINNQPTIERRKVWVAVAAHSMNRICQTLLLVDPSDGYNPLSSDCMFKRLCNCIADIFGACFTNLITYILQECQRSTMEKREETAFAMLELLGKMERIMEILDKDRRIPHLPDDKMAFIDEWRSVLLTTTVRGEAMDEQQFPPFHAMAGGGFFSCSLYY